MVNLPMALPEELFEIINKKVLAKYESIKTQWIIYDKVWWFLKKKIIKIYNGLFLSVDAIAPEVLLKNDFDVRRNLKWILKKSILQIALTL